MKTQWKWIVCMLLGAILAAASPAPVRAEETVSAEVAEDRHESAEQQEREEISGFTLDSVKHSSLLNADICSLTHTFSGAQLVWVRNSDPEVAFSIAFRTPYVDETDTNHIFEHAILASSEKYPAKDIFFDLSNKAYTTFVNAFTYPTFTMYPVSSVSEEQLLKAMDVYMSCMVAPGILTDENFFKREAVRLELTDPEAEISVNGTVFAEDTGYMTETGDVVYDHILDTLYPGEFASNMSGKAEYHVEDLTYEHTLETFERCYHFDNSLICLYGDLDILRFLDFLDSEYLSKQERWGTNLDEWKDPLTEAGYEEKVLPSPAYEGDAAENASYITYAIDMQDASEEDLQLWSVFTTLLNANSSPLNQMLRERGIQYPVQAVLETSTAKPFFCFMMYYANEDQMPILKELAQDTLEEVAENGLNPELLEAVLKQQELVTLMQRNNANVGVSLAPVIAMEWARTGRTDIYQQTEEILERLSQDEEQTLIRAAAEAACQPRRSALIATVPTPGLAEQHDEELAAYLKNLKDSMSEEEIGQLVADTEEFMEWNEEEIPNNDFFIDPAELPEPEPAVNYTVQEIDGVTVYAGSADVESAGMFRVYFDLEGMTREEIEYLMLYNQMLFELDTDRFTAEEIELKSAEYLSGYQTVLCYPNEESSNHRPMLRLDWNSLTGSFSESLDLLLNILTSSDLSNQEMTSYLLWRDAEAWDESRHNGNDIAARIAGSLAGINADTNAFTEDADGQDVYWLVSDIVNRLMTEENYPAELQEKFEQVRAKAYTNSRPVFMCVTAEDESQAVIDAAVSMLNSLPEKEDASSCYELPAAALRTAVYIDSSQNYTEVAADYRHAEGFAGRYLPFIYAVNDKYTVPVFRFRLGAYSAGSGAATNQGYLYSYTYSDPNVKKTVEALEALPDALAAMEITQAELEGYILNAYAAATFPRGSWGETMNEMALDFLGDDRDARLAVIRDIRNASVEEQEEAARQIAAVLENAAIATVGNEAMISAEKEIFDDVISFREMEGGEVSREGEEALTESGAEEDGADAGLPEETGAAEEAA